MSIVFDFADINKRLNKTPIDAVPAVGETWEVFDEHFGACRACITQTRVTSKDADIIILNGDWVNSKGEHVASSAAWGRDTKVKWRRIS